MTITMGNILPMVTGGLFYPATAGSGGTAGESLDVSPAILLRQYIIDVITLLQTPSGAAVWPCYVGFMPDGDFVPDDSVCIYDTAGVKDGRLMVGPTIQHYGIQLRIRSTEYQEGWTRADAISSGLDAVVNYDLDYNGETYHIYNVSRTTPIVPLGMEEETKRRWLFTANFLVTVSQIV